MTDETPGTGNAPGTGDARDLRPRVKGLGLRFRIALPLLLPVLGLLALSGVLLTQKLEEFTAMRQVVALSALATDASALVHELQRERGASGIFLGSKGTELVQELTAQRARTDARLGAIQARLRGADLAFPGGPAGAAGGLGETRRRISQLSIPPDESFTYFTEAIAHLLDRVTAAAAEVEAPAVARSISVYLSFLRAEELSGQERGTGGPGFASGHFDAARLRRMATLRDNQDLYFGIVAAAATPSQAEFFRSTVTGAPVDAVAKMRTEAAEKGLDGQIDGVTGGDWFAATTARMDLLRTVENRLANDLMSLAVSTGDAAQAAFYSTLAAILALLTLTIAVGALMIRAIVVPLAHHIRTMQRLASGETDLVISHSERRDELGGMARAIGVFRDQAVEKHRLAAAREDERLRAEAEKAAALQGMADTIESETSRALAQVSERTAAMAATANTMGASATRIGSSARGASAAASQALANAEAVATAAEELTASIREISAQVSQSAAMVGQAVAAGDETRATLNQLDGKVTSIGMVADMIREIAARTNLLALNASVEAARAGEAGKGFAVVASEVKALAMRTARSTKEITRHLAEVRAATAASVNAVGRIGGTITEIDQIATSIAAAVEQQGMATAEIARNASQTAQAAGEMSSRIIEVSTEAEKNDRQASQVHDGAAGLAAAVSDLKGTVVRAVRTSTNDVNRRLSRRHGVSARGEVTVPGQGPLTGRVIELSEGGARIQGMPKMPVGTRGVLRMEGVAASLPFVVRNQYQDALGLMFDRDDTTVVAINTALRDLVSRKAA